MGEYKKAGFVDVERMTVRPVTQAPGKGFTPSELINSGGTLWAENTKGNPDPTWKLIGAVAGTGAGGVVGDAAQKFATNYAIPMTIRYQTPAVSNLLGASILPANAFSSNGTSELTSNVVDRFAPPSPAASQTRGKKK
jgi:hypothetical protein